MNNFWNNLELVKRDLLLRLAEDTEFRLPRFLSKVATIKEDADRVSYVYDLLEKHNLFVSFVKDEKSDEMARKHRIDGNSFFKNGDYRSAFHRYNASLAYAKSDAEKALAYGNRSACFFNVEQFVDCIKDINQALRHGFPANKTKKLHVRKSYCEGFVNSEIFKIKQNSQVYFNPIPKIPIEERNSFIQVGTERIRLEYGHPRFGTHIVAARDITIGEILSIEKPFQFQLVEHFSRLNCNFCFTKCYSLIPCDYCTTAFYCSPECKVQDFEAVHKYECDIKRTITPFEYNKSFVLALKVTLSLKKSLPKIKLSRSVLQRSQFYESSEKELHNLKTNFGKKPASEVFVLTILAANLLHLVKKHTSFFYDAEHLEAPFTALLFYQILACSNNALEILEDRTNVIGTGIYPFSSRYNHSCAPNVLYANHGTTIVARAVKTIKQGEQCFINYVSDYTVLSKRERQDTLMKFYCFACRCQACASDWKTSFFPLPCSNHPIPNSVLKMRVTRETAKKYLPKIYRCVKQFQKYEPCNSFIFLQSLLMECFHVIGNRAWLRF